MDIKRRQFLRLAGAAVFAWPAAARAQTAKLPHVGILDFFPSAVSVEFLGPFHEGLRELGYHDGQNIHVEYASAEQSRERATALAADYVRRQVNIIVALATPAAHAAKAATSTIPIVMTVADPVATGLVASLARPEGNLTGVSTTSTDLAGKRLELLRELRPGATRIAFLGAGNDPNTTTFVRATSDAAKSIGVQVFPQLVTRPEEFDAAFDAMVKNRVEGLIVQPLFVGQRVRLAELALKHKLMLIADQHQFAQSGGLATYGIDRRVIFRRPAYFIDKILKGAKPQDLPIEQATKFQLYINAKTAKALGVTVPTKLLFTADEVIE